MFRSLRAFFLLCRVLASYGLQWSLAKLGGSQRFDTRWARVHATNARRLRDGFASLGGVFIKLGQVISVMGGFLPGAFRTELEALQDRVPPRDFRAIEGRLREAFGEAPLRHFATFDREPLAAASLAQVHRATLTDGREVVVKVLYPGIETWIARDLFVISLFIPILARIFPIGGLGRVLEQLRAMLGRETDYENELRNLERMRGLLSHRKDVVVPAPVAQLCRASVLTLDYEPGTKLSEQENLAERGIDPESVARLLTDCYLEMLFQHQVFHADPHPGNFLVRPGPVLVILDYGAVEEASDELVGGLRTAVLGALTRDANRVLEGAEQMGFVAPGGDRDVLREAGVKYLEAVATLRIDDYDRFDPTRIRKATGQTLTSIRAILRHMEYPEGYFYVERTFGLLFGLVAQLAPRKGLPGIAAPLASKMMLRSLAQRPATQSKAVS